MQRKRLKRFLYLLGFVFLFVSVNMGTNLTRFNTKKRFSNPSSSDIVTSEWERFTGGSDSDYGYDGK